MKLLAASLLIALTLSAPLALTAAPYESCSCSADDGSCSTSINCTGGCFAYCANNDSCRATCLRDSESGGGKHEMMLSMPVTLRFRESNGRDVSAELARVTGAEVTFSPSRADATINLEVDRLPLWNVLEILSESGRIQIAGDDFSSLRKARRALLYGERVSLCVQGATVRRLVSEMRYLTGLDIRVMSGDVNAVVNYSAKNVTFDEIVAQVSERAGVQITVK